LVFYLSISLIKKLKKSALKLGYKANTPCWVVEKATWQDEMIYKGTLENIEKKVSHIKGIAIILLGDFLKQKETEESHLYVKPLLKELK
jgi:precorrin-4/cobalt-precorrin-4 C11-methyltransferase